MDSRLRGNDEGLCTKANPHRGEASVRVGGEVLVLRPSFAALVAAEEELGPLLALVGRAAAGGLRLAEIVALFWHCLAEPPVELTRERLGEAVAAAGLTGVMPAATVVLRQVMLGS